MDKKFMRTLLILTVLMLLPLKAVGAEEPSDALVDRIIEELSFEELLALEELMAEPKSAFIEVYPLTSPLGGSQLVQSH